LYSRLDFPARFDVHRDDPPLAECCRWPIRPGRNRTTHGPSCAGQPAEDLSSSRHSGGWAAGGTHAHPFGSILARENGIVNRSDQVGRCRAFPRDKSLSRRYIAARCGRTSPR
jgi:hypothetical protein